MKNPLNLLKTSDHKENTLYFLGLGLITISLLCFLLVSYMTSNSDLFTGGFFVVFILCIVYIIAMTVYKLDLPRPRKNISQRIWINLVILFTISAFSLNESMHVFAVFPLWLRIYTVSSCFCFLIFPYADQLSLFFKSILFFIAGLALVLALYMTFYLLPLVPLSIIAMFFFGLSVHTFVPFTWLILLIHFLFIRKQVPKAKIWMIPGMILPLIFLSVYLYRWQNIQIEMNDLLAEKNVNASQTLPDAIVLAQKLPSDPLSEQIIVSSFKSQRFWDGGFGLNFGGVEKFHDPLSVIGMQFFGPVKMDYKTAEAILNIRRDYRHKTSRRLWTGTSLSTGSVSSNIEVYPEYRFAYQEKILTIHNDPAKRNRRSWFTSSTQEAVYTFHLPEGSIVTSLSLWINGKEEKSRLTTRQKADSAYTTIVGVEQRDPALVHWQEGNRITVTIFPCTPQEIRTFKIGFTTPLVENNGKLWLENVWFEGPDFNHAREVTQIMMKSNAETVKLPEGFTKDASGNKYIYKGSYNPYWKIGFEKVPLSREEFSFNGNKYYLRELKEHTVQTEYEEIFLDVMKEWTKEEYDQIINALTDKKIYVWLPEKIQVTSDNREQVWDELWRNQYALPFIYEITHPEKSVVITKSGHRSPLLSDLKDSEYAFLTTSYLNDSSGKIRVMNIGEDLSPFWKSLHELRAVDYIKVDLPTALYQISKSQFNKVEEDENSVAIIHSKVSIVKQPAPETGRTGKAPDHLLRMYAYNDVMRKIGRNYFQSQEYEEAVFSEAEEGYVVTPVTSMIVLESEKDYERMGIHHNKNTVGNAGILSGGAVPEPHEWVLILFVAVLILRYLYKKHKERLALK